MAAAVAVVAVEEKLQRRKNGRRANYDQEKEHYEQVL